MECLSTCYLNNFCLPWRRRRTTTKTPLTNFYYSRKLSFLVLASKDDNNNPKFDHWDQMELKFGRMIGEDPKLTLAKIMGRKLNPNVSYLEIEKTYNQKKRKGLLDDEILILPFDGGKESSNSLNKLKKEKDPSDDEILKTPIDDGRREASNSFNKLKLIRRPVPKEGVKFEVDIKSKVSEKKANPSIRINAVVDSDTKGSNLPNVVLRKPTIVRQEDITLDKTPRIKIKPNLVLKMSKEEVRNDLSDIILLNKPTPRTLINNPIKENINAGDSEESSFGLESSGGLKMNNEAKASDDLQSSSSFTLLSKPTPRTLINSPNQENINAGDYEESSFGLGSSGELKMTDEAKASDDLQSSRFTLLSKPKPRTLINRPIQENINAGDSEESSFGLGSSGGLKMTDEDKASDDLRNNSVTLSSKPKPRTLINNPIQENLNAGGDSDVSSFALEASGGLRMTDEPSTSDDLQNISFSSTGKSHSDGPRETSHDSSLKVSAEGDESKIGLQPLEQRDLERGLLEVEITQPFESNSLNLTSSFSKQVALQGKPQLFNPTNSFSKQDLERDLKEVEVTQPSESNSLNLNNNFSKQAALQGRPQRLEQSLKQISASPSEETTNLTSSIYNENAEIGHAVVAQPTKDHEDADWTRAEVLFQTEDRLEVELISCSTRGFVASFGSLIGFLPYRNIATRWRFIGFEPWLRNKGLDPSMYKHTLSISGSNKVHNMTLDDLLEIYDQEKIKFLSSFIEQKIRVIVILADRNSRRLMFSQRPKEKEELVEKKRSLMAKLSIGDIVKCCITKITYFGIFVDVDGVRALIHQSEVSWDAALNTSTIYKIGQILEAKVHQLNFELERITLSLKEITPDPLIGALEFVVGDRSSSDERLEAEYLDDQWTEVESLIKELQQIEGVQSVSKGRFFLSPGLAPTFQVYMASMFETQYKLLARSGNKVQEVLVRASLDKEQMKDVVLTCTKRVE